MKTALIIGGTRFFGKHLLEQLLAHDVKVTVISRGNADIPHKEQVECITVDRTDYKQMSNLVSNRTWDVLYDQICYDAKEASETIACFQDKVKKIVFTSSLSVYDPELPSPLKEADFSPFEYAYDLAAENVGYAEGKRQAEAVFVQNSNIPVVAVRLPIVLGNDDYTQRLVYYIQAVKEGRMIGLQANNVNIGFISSKEAGEFLFFAGKTNITGPVNAQSNGTISLAQLIEKIEEAVGEKANIRLSTEDLSPFAISEDWYMDTSKARAAEFSFASLEDWLLPLISEEASKR